MGLLIWGRVDGQLPIWCLLLMPLHHRNIRNILLINSHVTHLLLALLSRWQMLNRCWQSIHKVWKKTNSGESTSKKAQNMQFLFYFSCPSSFFVLGFHSLVCMWFHLFIHLLIFAVPVSVPAASNLDSALCLCSQRSSQGRQTVRRLPFEGGTTLLLSPYSGVQLMPALIQQPQEAICCAPCWPQSYVTKQDCVSISSRQQSATMASLSDPISVKSCTTDTLKLPYTLHSLGSLTLKALTWTASSKEGGRNIKTEANTTARQERQPNLGQFLLCHD